ncbi:unnamed protein product [Closterium sp. NIES-65]|nr:unnamed protein product [Closterium sp. NIES-65]
MDELKLWLSRLPAPTDLVVLIDTRLIRRIPNLDLKFRPHASAHAPALLSTDSATGRPTLIGGISILSFNRAISMSSPLPSADGRLLTVHLNYLREQIRLIAIYAPTQFYERRVWWTTTLAPALEAPTAAAASMLVGDFNSVVLPIDRNRPLKDFEMREGTSFAKLMDDHALVDTFRTLYPTPIDVFSFYGRQHRNCAAPPTSSRLDMIYISRAFRLRQHLFMRPHVPQIIDSALAVFPSTPSPDSWDTWKLDLTLNLKRFSNQERRRVDGTIAHLEHTIGSLQRHVAYTALTYAESNRLDQARLHLARYEASKASEIVLKAKLKVEGHREMGFASLISDLNSQIKGSIISSLTLPNGQTTSDLPTMTNLCSNFFQTLYSGSNPARRLMACYADDVTLFLTSDTELGLAPLAFNRSLLKPDGRPFGTRQHERFLLTIPEEFHDDATRILPELIKAIKRPWWTALRTPHVSCASSGDWFMLSDDHYSISHLALRVIAYIPPSSVSANVHLVSPDHHITHTPANTGLFRLQDLIEVHVRDWWLAGPLHTGAGLGARIDLLQDGVPSLADIRRLLYRAQPLTHHSRWTRDLTLPPPPLPGLKDPFLKDQPSRQRDILFRLYTLTLPSGSRFQYFDDRGVHCALATSLPTKLASALHHALVVRPPVPPRTFFAAKSPPRLPISTSQPQHRLAAAICHRRRIGASPPHRRLAAWPPQRRAASRSPPHRHPQRTFSLPHNALPLPSLCSHSPPIPSFPFASLLDVLVAHPFPSPPFPSFALPALPFPSPFFPSFTLPAIPFPSPPFPFLPLFCPPCTSLPLSSLPFPSHLLPSLHFPSPLLPSLSFPCFTLPALPFPSPPFPFLPFFCPPCTSLPLSFLPFPSHLLPSLHFPSPLLPSLSFPCFALPALPFPSPPFPFLPFFCPPCTSLPLSFLPFPSHLLPSLHFPSPLLPSLSFPCFALPALPFPSPPFPFLPFFCPPCTSLPLSFLPFPSLVLPSLHFPSSLLPSLPPLFPFPSLPFPSIRVSSPPCPIVFLPTSPFFSLPPLFSPYLPFFLPATPFFSMPPLFSPCLPFFLHASPFFSMPPLFSPCLPFLLPASPFFSMPPLFSLWITM